MLQILFFDEKGIFLTCSQFRIFVAVVVALFSVNKGKTFWCRIFLYSFYIISIGAVADDALSSSQKMSHIKSSKQASTSIVERAQEWQTFSTQNILCSALSVQVDCSKQNG